MEHMKIEATNHTPLVELSTEGKLMIHGRSIIEDPLPFYKRIVDWIPLCQAKNLNVEIQIEYINTSSTKVLLNLLKKIKYFYNSNNLTISWYYESDDEEMLDLGKDFESMVCVPFDFYEMSEKSV